MRKVSTETLENLKPRLAEMVRSYARRGKGCELADVRLEIEESAWAAAECGRSRAAERDVEIALGVRVLARAGGAASAVAPGYYAMRLGPKDMSRWPERVRNALQHASQRARANSRQKGRAMNKSGPLGGSLWSTRLADRPPVQADVPARFRVDPRGVALDAIIKASLEASQAAMAVASAVRYSYAVAMSSFRRQVYADSAGTLIDQSWALSEGDGYVVAERDGVSQEVYDTMGSDVGWEIVEEGIRTDLEQSPRFVDFEVGLAKDATELCSAPKLPATEGPVVVVTDPHYNTLLVHEIVGHPVELDRALKMETAYAGRTWLFSSPRENLVGSKIGSDTLNAYSDPSLPGFGHYAFDDEGVPAHRVNHVERGLFRGFMNSRQTSGMMSVAGLSSPPNGHYKATFAGMVPLIRMSTTVFAAGKDDPKQMVRDVEHGYFLSGHRIPSISESRENFRISARKVYEIRNGEIGQLYRDGGLVSDSREFFMNLDAAGTDFRIFPIPNCGKGQPMQTKRLGNGGPTLRSRARLI